LTFSIIIGIVSSQTCPSGCDSCPSANQCVKTCSGSCNLTCPTGFACTIQCFAEGCKNANITCDSKGTGTCLTNCFGESFQENKKLI